MVNTRVPRFLEPSKYAAVEHHMLNGLLSKPGPGTFSAQLTKLQATVAPDLYLTTAYSAVPVADAIRGFYAAKVVDGPQLGYIRADSLATNTHKRRQDRIHDEAERLATLVSSASRICIVEQMVVTGNCLKLAQDILLALNVHPDNISVVAGHWYHDTSPEEVDLGNVSSDHASFMIEVGQKAATLTMPEAY